MHLDGMNKIDAVGHAIDNVHRDRFTPLAASEQLGQVFGRHGRKSDDAKIG